MCVGAEGATGESLVAADTGKRGRGWRGGGEVAEGRASSVGSVVGCARTRIRDVTCDEKYAHVWPVCVVLS